MLLKAILKNLSDTKKVKACLMHIPDLLSTFDNKNLEESQILFLISVVEMLRHLIIEKVVPENSNLQRLVFQLLDSCFVTIKSNPKITIVASNQTIAENSKNFDEKKISWHENHQAFSSTISMNTKKDQYFYPVNNYYSEDMLDLLKETLVNSMKFFVNSKLKGSQIDFEDDIHENLDNFTKYFDKTNSNQQDQEENATGDDAVDGSLSIEIISNCCKVILVSAKLNKSVAFETIKGSMSNLMKFIKSTKEDLLAKRPKNEYVLIEVENKYSSEEVILLQQLESSTIYLLNLCIKL